MESGCWTDEVRFQDLWVAMNDHKDVPQGLERGGTAKQAAEKE